MGSQAQAIAKWAEAHTADKLPAPNAGVEHLDPIEIIDILRWDTQGLTQEQIAAKCNPPRSQATISRCLRKYGTDTTTEAKRIFAAGAAPAALKILAEGLPRDLIAVQKGLKVLAEDTSSIKLAIGLSLPGLSTMSLTGTDTVGHSPDVVDAND
jgi:hypothetical protein